MCCTSVVLECGETIPLNFLQPHASPIAQSYFIIKQFVAMSIRAVMQNDWFDFQGVKQRSHEHPMPLTKYWHGQYLSFKMMLASPFVKDPGTAAQIIFAIQSPSTSVRGKQECLDKGHFKPFVHPSAQSQSPGLSSDRSIAAPGCRALLNGEIRGCLI